MCAHRIITAVSLAGTALLAVSGPLAAAPRQAPDVTVRFSPVVGETIGPSAARIKADMERDLSSTLGASLRGKGETLVVTVTSIMMADLAGADGRRGGDQDGMESTATVFGPHGAVVEAFPIASSVSADPVGPVDMIDTVSDRVDTIAHVNASWIERYLGE